MKNIKKVIALILAVLMISTATVFSVNAAEVTTDESKATNGITVHYYTETANPQIYYWNSLPQNIEVAYPGKTMTSEGENWYSYTFSNITKINMMFIDNGKQSKELTRSGAGEYWYKGGKWYTKKPSAVEYDRADLREDSIYFIITTRFYDGDTGNNVHCWDDAQANNPDSDPAWRGDFKGLIDKMDYIKAMGFSAIWITPIVSNASGYDYHGYHAFDFATVDPRYLSDDCDYQDVINAAHEKGLKIIQDVVWNHTSNFGEATLGAMFTKQYDKIQDLGDADCMKVIEGSDLDKTYPGYSSLTPAAQFQARLTILKNMDKTTHDPDNNYHRELNMGYESSIEQQGSMAGDCVDINTENPNVAKYLTSTYMDYVNMGVDSFRLDTEKHINRWTLNSAYFPAFSKVENFYIFGEVCSRVRETWNHNIPSSSPCFFTWAETESAWIGNWNTTSPTANIQTSINHYDAHRTPDAALTSTNAYLNGNEYHTPDYSQSNGTGVIDFTMHRNFETASGAYAAGINEDKYFNDSTWNVTYVDSHDYGPDSTEKYRYSEGTQAWAENMALIFTFRGIPCVYYGSEIEFQKNMIIDNGPTLPLAQTGRAYYGDNIEGTVTATDYSQYTASGKVAETLNYPLAKHIQRLNQIRRAIPALQKGQYSTSGVTGDMCYKRGYTDPTSGEKSFCCVAVTNAASFTGIPNGTYIDAVSGDKKTVSNGSLSISAPGKGNLRCYVLSSNGYTGISGKIGTDGTYLK